MCKHIHLVRRKLDERDEVTPGNAIHGMEVDTMYIQAELDTIAANVDKSYEGEPHKIQNQIKHLCARIEELSSRTLNKEVLLQLKVQLNAALNTFLSLSKADSYSNIRVTSNVPSNKNVDKQQRFYSIKKKRKRDICMKFAKPTRDEKERFEKEPEWLPTFISRSYPVHASAEEKHMTLQRNAEKSFTEREQRKALMLIGIRQQRKHVGKISPHDLLFDEEHPSIGILDFEERYSELENLFSNDAWEMVTKASM
eukprot:Seg1510.6 transcript_id=Seg1510.6/GoldUCD/mRNA.D3Y31 product="hypothetical protein" protein_id=Seg1510.6/GoldUCD/D3Y31